MRQQVSAAATRLDLEKPRTSERAKQVQCREANAKICWSAPQQQAHSIQRWNPTGDAASVADASSSISKVFAGVNLANCWVP